MAYTRLDNSRIRKISFGIDTLEGAALTFIRESCEGLRFDKVRDDAGNTDRDGASRGKHQIPFNNEKDIERLCLENAVRRFLHSGKKEDAFDVYFCYLEMFVGDYRKTRRMIELLSEYEANGSGLLMKHRDHYSHSVYVFCLGMALYQTNAVYRNDYCRYYGITDEREAACHFLRYWGLSSLFHDIGYPFELPFEQVASYFEVNNEDRSKRPFISYNGLESFTGINKAIQRLIGRTYSLGTDRIFRSTDEVFAFVLHRQLGDIYYFSEEEMLSYLRNKPTKPDKFNHFMDHAYFSATVLFKKLFDEIKVDFNGDWDTATTMDALTAIILHNSLYKFSVAYYKDPVANVRLRSEWHPLGFMLMLCDELQCWDRTAYGRNSKLEVHPMNCRFTLKPDSIGATYVFDEAERIKIDKYLADVQRDKKAKLKAFSSFIRHEDIVRTDGTRENVTEFQADIERIVDLSSIRLSVDHTIEKHGCGRRNYLSSSSFINLYKFAGVLHGLWSIKDEWKDNKKEKLLEYLSDPHMTEELHNKFGELSLEYKLSNISQAKAFDRYLGEIGCFYSDKPVDYEMVDGFSEQDIKTFAPMEHRRWLQDHYDMGWTYGEPASEDRELVREHRDMIPGYEGFDVTEEEALANYKRLDKEEQDKDADPMECMLAMLRLYDGIRIYRMSWMEL